MACTQSPDFYTCQAQLRKYAAISCGILSGIPPAAQDLQISSRGFGARSAFGIRGIKLLADGIPPVPAWQQASQQVLAVQHQRTAIPRHVGQTVRDIWEMQPKLEQPRPRQVEATAQSERFRAGYDFLVLRELAGEDTGGMGAWWTRWQDADPGLRAEMARALEDKPAAAKKKRRRKPNSNV